MRKLVTCAKVEEKEVEEDQWMRNLAVTCAEAKEKEDQWVRWKLAVTCAKVNEEEVGRLNG